MLLEIGQSLDIGNTAAAVNLDQVCYRLAHTAVVIDQHVGDSGHWLRHADDGQGPVAFIEFLGFVSVQQVAHKVRDHQSIQLLRVDQIVEDIGLGFEALGVSHVLADKTDGIDIVFPGHVGDAVLDHMKDLNAGGIEEANCGTTV